MATCKECFETWALQAEYEKLDKWYEWTCFACCNSDHESYDAVNAYRYEIS